MAHARNFDEFEAMVAQLSDPKTEVLINPLQGRIITVYGGLNGLKSRITYVPETGTLKVINFAEPRVDS